MRPRKLFALLVAAAVPLAAVSAAGAARPTKVGVAYDALGLGDVGFNGNEVIHTPNLDALAAGGVRFERFYAASAVCSPTRATCSSQGPPVASAAWP